ncbi:MAG TPA: Clp protease N-terminal domain-containing protein [Solirubrobacteraceae bacterium]
MRENEGVAARILLSFDADSEKIRNEVIRMLSGPHGQRPTPPQPSGGAGPHARPTGAASLWARIGPVIRERLGREPDAGDLLVMLARIKDGLIARTLAELGVDDRALDNALERARAQGPSPFEEQIELLRTQRAAAESRGDAEAVAALRAEELRTLRERDERLLAHTRARLGIGEEPGESPCTGDSE